MGRTTRTRTVSDEELSDDDDPAANANDAANAWHEDYGPFGDDWLANLSPTGSDTEQIGKGYDEDEEDETTDQ
jgi:hypothetical protein